MQFRVRVKSTALKKRQLRPIQLVLCAHDMLLGDDEYNVCMLSLIVMNFIMYVHIGDSYMEQ